MESSEGSNNDNGRDEAEDGATILRFPRDWFGPPEELVPFGPRAEAEATVAERYRTETSASAAARTADGQSGTPSADVRAAASRAEAFWSEESADIHDAVEELAPAVPVIGAGTDIRRRYAPWLREVPARGVLVLACCALLALGLVGRVMLSGASRRAVPPASPLAAMHVHPWVAVSHPPAVRHATSPVKRARSERNTRARGNRETVVQTASTEPAQEQVSSAPAPVQATQPSSSSQTASSSGPSQSGASAASAQPSPQPAFGANGALGPGASPNS